MKRLYCVFGLVLLLAAPTWSVEEPLVFGPRKFEVGTNHITLSRHTFSPTTTGSGYLRLKKESAGQALKGGFLFFNRKLIPLRSFIEGEDIVFYKDVTFQDVNHLTVFVRGDPGAAVSLEIRDAPAAIPPPEIVFSARPLAIAPGDSTELSWHVVNGDLTSIDHQIGNVETSGTLTVAPLETTTYRLAAIGPGGSATDAVTITVTPVPPSVAFAADPAVIAPGSASTLTWSSMHADSCVIEPGSGAVEVNGCLSVAPETTTTYTAAVTGPGGIASATVTVVVARPPAVTLDVSPTQVALGETVMLTWSAANADECVIEPDIGKVPPSGSMSVELWESTTFTLTATGPGGKDQAQASVAVVTAPTLQVNISPPSILQGEAALLSWTSSGAEAVTIAPGVGSVALEGAVRVAPLETTAYTVSASGPNGTTTQTLTLTVDTPGPSISLTAEPLTVESGQRTELVWRAGPGDFVTIEPDLGLGPLPWSGSATVFPEQTTTYRLTAFGMAGVSSAEVTVVVAAGPTADLSVAPASIRMGEAAILTWSSTRAEVCTITPAVGTVGPSGSLQVSPETTTTYTLVAANPSGEVVERVTIAVQAPLSPPEVIFDCDAAVLAAGQGATLTWQAAGGDWAFLSPGIGQVPLSGAVQVFPTLTTTYSLTIAGPGGVSLATKTIQVAGVSEVQPPGSFGASYQSEIPLDAVAGSLEPERLALVTGFVHDEVGKPLAGVQVSVHARPEWGTSRTDDDGRFVLAVEGGTTHTLEYAKQERLLAHRRLAVSPNDIAVAETLRMVSPDPTATTVAFSGNAARVFTHRSSPVEDGFGRRACTLVVTGDNQASAVDRNGQALGPLATLNIRATEYTRPENMPAKLPPNSGFTYCVELSADGLRHVRFEHPVVAWVDNFLGFEVGEIVPVGFYDREGGRWIPQENGLVVALLDEDGDGVVDALDADGDGLPDDLDLDGERADEVVGLGDPQVYLPGASYWRFEVAHFSPWDCNWPFGPEEGAIPPNPEGNPSNDEELAARRDCRRYSASFVNDRSRTLHETIPLPGSDFALHYSSARTKGYRSGRITVPLSGEQIPSSLKRIEVEIAAAGNRLQQSLPALPYQLATVNWDGTDFRGEAVGIPIDAQVRIGFVYDGVYNAAAIDSGRAFAKAGERITGIPTRQEVVLWRDSVLPIYPSQAKAQGLAAGWTLSVHHALNPLEPSILNKGDGSAITSRLEETIETLAGSGIEGFQGDDGPASDAWLNTPFGVAVDTAGNVFLADTFNHCLRKRSPDGTIHRLAGSGQPGDGGDGGAAQDALLNTPIDVVVDESGNIYFTDSGNHRVRKIDSNGIVTTVVGTGEPGFGGENGSATATMLNTPLGLDMDVEGNLYVVDSANWRVIKIDPGGLVSKALNFDYYVLLYGVAVDSDGNLYVSDRATQVIYKLTAAGKLSIAAGTASAGGFAGDGGDATRAQLNGPNDLCVDRQGNVYVADYWNHRIRRIFASGIIDTVAGSGLGGFDGDNGPAARAQLNGPCGIALDRSGHLYVADSSNHRIRRIVGTPSALKVEGEYLFVEEAGLMHTLSAKGRHEQTLDLDTRTPVYRFGYDAEERLTTVTDRFGAETTIDRNSAGRPVAIRTPEGLVTQLWIDADDHLTRITTPDEASYVFEYSTGGLLTAKLDPVGNRFEHDFDLNGRITQIRDSEGGAWSYENTLRPDGDIATRVTGAEGGQTDYEDATGGSGSYRGAIVDPSGDQTLLERVRGGASLSKQLPCDLTLDMEYALDAFYKSKRPGRLREITPTGLERTSVAKRTYTDNDVDGLPNLITDILAVNGREWRVVHDRSAGTVTKTSPAGRILTRAYDPFHRLPLSVQRPGFFDTHYSHDAAGRLTGIEVGTRTTFLGYNDRGFLESILDPQNHRTSFFHDAIGRVTGIRRPDGSSLGFTYDANGNVTTLTNAGFVDHAFEFNRVNAAGAYNTPLSGAYRYTYDRERRLTGITYPSGQNLERTYSNGLLTQVLSSDRRIDFSYLCGSKLAAAECAGERIDYTYDGPLQTSASFSGSVNAMIAYDYDPDFRLAAVTYAGTSEDFRYDADGLLTGAGRFTIARHPDHGLPTQVDDGWFNVQRTFNGYGELESEIFNVGPKVVAEWHLERDDQGRIVSKSEAVDGVAVTYGYGYDAMGRLTQVLTNGDLIESYDYDANGTRIFETNIAKGVAGRRFGYDDEEHLLTAGNDAFRYDLDGFMASREVGGRKTTYEYSLLGELRSISLPDARRIEYLHDPHGRRIVKTVDGEVVEKYLWQGMARLLAVYDAQTNLLMRFEYADGRLPPVMTMGEEVFYLIYDPVGSLRAVVNQNGAVIKRIDYDSFGTILADTNPTLGVPFGFGGGLYDPDSRLVRFGCRDYDPDTGRWTAKDPIFFAGGDTDLYGYVQNDPINWIDALGLFGSGLQAGGDAWGHSDFSGNGRFDYNREDQGWTSPVVQPWRHFKDLQAVEGALAKAIAERNTKNFERLMHQGQDYFSHFNKGFRWYPQWEYGAGHWPYMNVDDDLDAWRQAEDWTQTWLNRWDDYPCP